MMKSKPCLDCAGDYVGVYIFQNSPNCGFKGRIILCTFYLNKNKVSEPAVGLGDMAGKRPSNCISIAVICSLHNLWVILVARPHAFHSRMY